MVIQSQNNWFKASHYFQPVLTGSDGFKLDLVLVQFDCLASYLVTGFKLVKVVSLMVEFICSSD